MFVYLSIAFYVVAAGNFIIPSESSTVTLEKDHKVVITKMATAADEENVFCNRFPSRICFDDGRPDELKTEVEIFKQEFCPGFRSMSCVQEFTQRCLPSPQGQKLKMKFFNRSTAALDLELCGEGPYDEENLRHVECMRYAKFMYVTDCPMEENHGKKRQYGLTLQKYMKCVSAKIRLMCGTDALLFMKNYLKPWDISVSQDEFTDNSLPAYNV